MKKLFLVAVGILLSTITWAQNSADAILGTWKTGSGNAHVQIYKTTSGHYAGKIIWLQEPIDLDTKKPKVDKRNPDEKLRSKPVMGLVNIYNFKYNAKDNIWEDGKVYDPKNGKLYSCKLTLKDNNTLNVRGYVGITLLGRTDVWTRQK
jgi:uncharacterized protein (DUF2147 family)